MRKLAWLALAAALALAACNGGEEGGVRGDEDRAATPTAQLGTVVTYDTEDGVRIVAQFALPTGVDNPPVVILLHQFQGSREQWQPLLPQLLEQGYAVLAPDLRSFGQSTRVIRNGSEERYELTNLDDMVKDVAAALDWLQTQEGVNTDRIAVVGASVGANLAYVASGAFEAVDTTVAMSPNASPSGDALLGRNVPDFAPRSVLFMSDEAEAADARALAQNVADPVQVKAYEGLTAHGVQLLVFPRAVQDILDWLSQTL